MKRSEALNLQEKALAVTKALQESTAKLRQLNAEITEEQLVNLLLMNEALDYIEAISALPPESEWENDNVVPFRKESIQ